MKDKIVLIILQKSEIFGLILLFVICIGIIFSQNKYLLEIKISVTRVKHWYLHVCIDISYRLRGYHLYWYQLNIRYKLFINTIGSNIGHPWNIFGKIMLSVDDIAMYAVRKHYKKMTWCISGFEIRDSFLKV